MTRSHLSRLVLAMFGLLLFGFVFILVGSLRAPAISEAITDVEKFAEVAIGQTVLRRIEGRRVWLTRLSESQRHAATLLQEQLVYPDAGCKPESVLCVLDAATARDGIELTYTDSPPPQLPNAPTWMGGFVDPGSGAVFDLLGRAYRLERTTDGQSLQVIDITD